MASGLVPQSSTPDRYPLTLKAPSCHSAALSGALPSSSPPRKLVHCPSGPPSYRNHPSAPIAFADPSHFSVPPFSKPIRRPSGPPFSKAQHQSLAAQVGKLISLDKTILDPSTPQSHDSHPQFLIPLSVASSSSRQVPSFSELGSKASAPSSPSQSDMEPRPDAISIRKAMPAVSFSALINWQGIDTSFLNAIGAT